MKNFILYALFLLAMVSAIPNAHAAFPVNSQTEENVAATAAENKVLTVSPHESVNVAVAPAPAPSAPAGGGPGLSIAALVLGIVAVLTSFWTIAIIAGALAIIFGAMNLHGPKPGMALAGLILGIIGVALALII